ncbi:MAG TPA: nucleotidyltransferase domain-containing protein [Ignavibacteria bacterium]|nr:nucleotidyltransferase domain-containing protein [Ignavibacteria bacterium]
MGNINNFSIKKFINELNSSLLKNYPEFKGTYFFGSRAFGYEQQHSDYDIAIIFDRFIDWKFESKISEVLVDLMLKYNVVIDYKIYSSSDILNPITDFRRMIKEKGIFFNVKRNS